MELNIKGLSKKYNDNDVFYDFDLKIEQNKITCILGASGVGKTTLLNLIAEVIKPDYGIFEGFDNKSFSYIFQDARLLEWKTVYQNVEFVIKNIYPKNKCKEVIEKYLKIVDLCSYGHYYPRQLSGGMKQRVAIARAFAYPSDILLMDEPFSAIDLKLKISITKKFLDIWNQDKRTVIFVTHDIEEALFLGDDVYILTGYPPNVSDKIEIEIPKLDREYKDERLDEISKRIYRNILRNS